MTIDGDELELGGALIRVRPPSTLSISASAEEASREVDAWTRCTSVALGASTSWCCAVGWEDGTILAATPSPPTVDIIGRVRRIDFAGGYDPGGFERVAFHRLDDDDLLLEWELGVARITRTGIGWRQNHDDLSARVEEVTSNEVWLRSEDSTFGFRLGDGRPIGR